MANKDRVVKMKKYKKKDSWNIGMFVFAVIFIYLLATIVMYVTKDRIAVYEVRQGSILKDNTVTAIALRDEELVYADESGYVNYFMESGQKLAVGKRVYTLSKEKLKTEVSDEDKEDSVELTSEELKSLQHKVQMFNKTFKNEEFSSASNLQKETSSIVQNKSSQNRVVKLKNIVKEKNVEGLKVYRTKEDGVIQLSMDGMEGLKMEDVTSDLMKKVGYTRTELTNNTSVSNGDPVYRLINDEKWRILFPLTSEMKDTLKKMMGDRTFLNMNIKFLKDNEVMRGALLIYEKSDKESYGYIDFTTSMIRYAQDRYLDIELILEDETGLKIPKSSVVEKEFYIIPMDFLTTGGASRDVGVNRQSYSKKGNVITEFVPVDVYYKDEEKGIAYINANDISESDQLIMPESTQTITLSQRGKLQGVYNVNKGYAAFKRVDVLCESEEYYIIEEGSSYGLSNYDRIALDGNSVVEEQIVNQ